MQLFQKKLHSVLKCNFFSLILLCFIPFSATYSNNYSIKELRQKADSLIHIKNYPEAELIIESFEKATNISNNIKQIIYHYYCSRITGLMDNPTQAIIHLEKCIANYTDEINNLDSIPSRIYTNYAYNIDKLGNVDSAIKNYYIALEKIKSVDNYRDLRLYFIIHNSLAYCLLKKEQWKEAEQHLLQIVTVDDSIFINKKNLYAYYRLFKIYNYTQENAKAYHISKVLEKFFLKDSLTYNMDLAYLYNTLAFSAYLKKDYLKAISFYSKNIKPTSNNSNTHYSLLRLVAIYLHLEKKDLVNYYIDKTIKYTHEFKPEYICRTYSNIAYTYAFQKDSLKAEKYISLAIKEFHKINPITENENNIFHDFIGWTQIKLGKYNEAIDFFKHQLLTQKSYIINRQSSINSNIGYCFKLKNELDSAIHYLKTAIDIYKPAELANIEECNPSRLSELHWNLASSYFDRYKKSSNMDDLYAALKYCKNSNEIIDNTRNSFDIQTSQLTTVNDTYDFFTLNIKTNFELYKQTQDIQYLNNCITSSQKGKSYALLHTLNTQSNLATTNIPKELLDEKEKCKHTINSLSANIDELSNSEFSSDEKLLNTNTALNREITKLDSINNIINAQYPEYSNLINQKQTLNAHEIQKSISSDEILIDYFINEDNLWSFAFTRDTILFHHQAIDSLFFKKLKTIENQLSTPFNGLSTKDDIESLSSACFSMHNCLIAPYKEQCQRKKLIISPCYQLAHLPFEILLNQTTKNNYDFRTFPWLIKSHPISYIYNPALLPYYKKSERTFNKLVTFAPSYSGTKLQHDTLLISQSRDAINNSLRPIKSAIDEVNAASTIFNGNNYINENAQLSTFLNNTNSDNVIHLAMHALTDDLNPLNSQLIFSQKNDSSSLLKAHEIYNLKINSPMIVLSSCNSGKGTINKGEGAMSLARAFTYAGAQSVVMTLWAVDDMSASKLNTLFYEELKQKEAKDIALQKAKLNFLYNSDRIFSHPYYWANYVVIGETAPIKQKKSVAIWLLLLMIPLILYIFQKKGRTN